MSKNKISSLVEQVKGTMKSTETEGPYELYFTRTPGYLFALFFRKIGVHPIAVTLLSMVLGILSGPLLASFSMIYVVAGCIVLIVANWLDCADGQLARLTNKKTLIGRILDGFAGDTWFFSIYFFVCFNWQHVLAPWGKEWGLIIWLMAAYSGFICHARQCALGDYYRNIHYLTLDESGKSSEFTRYLDVKEHARSLQFWSKDWFEKIYLFFYARYTKSQESMTPQFNKLVSLTNYGTPTSTMPQWANKYLHDQSIKLIPLCNILTFDLRVAILFSCLLLQVAPLFFAIEIICFESLRFYVRYTHEKCCKEIIESLNN